MNKTITITCAWGQGPDVMVNFKDHQFILYEKPRHNKPPQGDYKHGFVTKGSCDLTEKEARDLGNALIQAADKAQEYENAIEAVLRTGHKTNKPPLIPANDVG